MMNGNLNTYQRNNYPYMPPLQQATYQPPQMMPQYPVIAGRIVNNAQEISASDVPMDGKAVFVKADNSELYVKQWNPNGTIQTVTYKPCEEEQWTNTPQTQNSGQYEAITSKLNDIYERLNDIVPKRTKKETQTNES